MYLNTSFARKLCLNLCKNHKKTIFNGYTYICLNIYISLFDTLVHIPFLLVFDEYTCSFVAIALAATAVLLQAVPMLQVPDLFFGLAACLAAQDWGRV